MKGDDFAMRTTLAVIMGVMSIFVFGFLPANSSAAMPKQVPTHSWDVSAQARCALSTGGARGKQEFGVVTIDKYHVWLVGPTGAGKTTLAGLLSGGLVTGKGGFMHDTVKISAYPGLFMSGPEYAAELVQMDVMDTRGYMDTEYTVHDLQHDLFHHSSTFYRSKIVMVIKEERMYKETLTMLQQASALSNGSFVTVISLCSDEKRSVADLRGVMTKNGIPHGAITCYNKYTDGSYDTGADRAAPVVKRNELMGVIHSSPFVDIRSLYRYSIVTRMFQRLDALTLDFCNAALGSWGGLVGMALTAVGISRRRIFRSAFNVMTVLLRDNHRD